MAKVETERKIKRLRRLSALATSAVLFAACAGNADSAPSQIINTSQTSTSGNETPKAIQTPEITETPINIEQLFNEAGKSPEDIAKIEAFKFIIMPFQDSSQQFSSPDNLIKTSYKMDSNLSEYTPQVPEVMNGNGTTKIPLKASFALSQVYTFEHNSNLAKGFIETGGLEINDLNVSVYNTSWKLSAADKASGKEWNGYATINYTHRTSGVINYIGWSIGAPKDNVQKFIDSNNETRPVFSPWSNVQETLYFEMQNGKMNIINMPLPQDNIPPKLMPSEVKDISMNCSGQNPAIDSCLIISTPNP